MLFCSSLDQFRLAPTHCWWHIKIFSLASTALIRHLPPASLNNTLNHNPPSHPSHSHSHPFIPDFINTNVGIVSRDQNLIIDGFSLLSQFVRSTHSLTNCSVHQFCVGFSLGQQPSLSLCHQFNQSKILTTVLRLLDLSQCHQKSNICKRICCICDNLINITPPSLFTV